MTDLKHTLKMDPNMVQLVGRSLSGEVLIPMETSLEVHNLRMRFYRLARALADLNPEEPNLKNFSTRSAATIEWYNSYPEYAKQVDHAKMPYTLGIMCGRVPVISRVVRPAYFQPSEGPTDHPNYSPERQMGPPLDLDLTTDNLIEEHSRAEGLAATLGLMDEDPELKE